MVMVLAARDNRLEPGAALADLDPLDKPLAVQEVERPVDARDPDPLAARPDPVGDLLGAEAAILLGE